MFAAAWQDWPAIAAYRAAVRDAAASGEAGVPSPEAAEAAVAALLGADGWIAETVAALAEAMRADPRAAPFPAIAGGAQQGLVLIDDAAATISIAAIPVDRLAARKQAGGGRGSIGFEGAVTLYRVIAGGAARLGWWDSPAIDDHFDAARRPRCRRRGTGQLEDGMMLRVDGRRETFIVDHAARDILWVQALVKPGRAALRVEYDARTQALVGASAGDPAASHADMLMALLAASRRTDAAPGVARWLDDPRFFLRWSAARTLATLDPAYGVAAVRRLADDPHRDVAAAARAALARAAARSGSRPCL